MSQPLKVTALALLMCIPSSWAQNMGSKADPDCKASVTQKAMSNCAYEDFLAANAVYADSNKLVIDRLEGKQRDLFRRSQKAWTAYRTTSCAFESSAIQGGRAQGMVNWQCAARMTRARVSELKFLLNCSEGDLDCVRLKK